MKIWYDWDEAYPVYIVSTKEPSPVTARTADLPDDLVAEFLRLHEQFWDMQERVRSAIKAQDPSAK